MTCESLLTAKGDRDEHNERCPRDQVGSPQLSDNCKEEEAATRRWEFQKANHTVTHLIWGK